MNSVDFLFKQNRMSDKNVNRIKQLTEIAFSFNGDISKHELFSSLTHSHDLYRLSFLWKRLSRLQKLFFIQMKSRANRLSR